MDVEIKYFDGSKEIAEIATGDWIDLRANQTVHMDNGEFRIIKLGVGMKLPEGYEAHILPRSSTFKKWGIIMANGMGVVDNSYSGDEDEWGFPAIALRDTHIYAGDRICQFRVMPVQPHLTLNVVDSLDDTSRGGFGSTGTN